MHAFLFTASTPPHRGRREKVYTPKTATLIKTLRKDARRYQKAARIKSRRRLTTREALEKLKLHVTPDFHKLLSSQLALHCRKRKGRRLSREVKEFALNMYFHGPSSYRQLSKVFALPPPRSLRRWLPDIPMTPGIISNVLNILKDVVKNWPLEDQACIIAFDEMSVRPNLQYDTKHDVVIAFSDEGSERTTAVANVAFVALLSGISRLWVMQVAIINKISSAFNTWHGHTHPDAPYAQKINDRDRAGPGTTRSGRPKFRLAYQCPALARARCYGPGSGSGFT